MEIVSSYLEGRNQIGLCDFWTNGFLQIGELVGHHVAHPPGFVLCALAKSWHHQLFNIFCLEKARDGHTGLDGQKANGILLILR